MRGGVTADRITPPPPKIIESFRFDYGYDYRYEI
jgi:hypothetical protein